MTDELPRLDQIRVRAGEIDEKIAELAAQIAPRPPVKEIKKEIATLRRERKDLEKEAGQLALGG